MKFERHPLSSAFPDMPPEDFAALVADIKKNGLREPAWVCDNMILDGWHRYRACQEARAPFRYDYYKGSNRVAFVLSKNTHRRHLTASQRAAAVVACHAWIAMGANQHTAPAAGGSAPGADPLSPEDPDADVLPVAEGRHPVPTLAQEPVSEKEMAKEANVGERTIRQAKAAQKAGLGDKVRDGELSAKRAAEMASAKEGRAPKPPKAAPADKRDKRIAELEAEVAALKDEMEQVREGAAEAVAQAEIAADMLKTEPAQLLLKQATEIRRLTRDRNDYQNKCGEMAKQLRALERKLSRYEGQKAA